MLTELVVLGLGLTGLEIISDTPGALCPPLELTQQAVDARLGEVKGGPYQARYSLIHDAERGTASVRLVLTEAEGQMLLERYLPVPAGGCTDLAAAIAVILERYFQAISGTQALPPTDPPPAPAPPDDAPPATDPAQSPAVAIAVAIAIAIVTATACNLGTTSRRAHRGARWLRHQPRRLTVTCGRRTGRPRQLRRTRRRRRAGAGSR